jgi:ComF family protein
VVRGLFGGPGCVSCGRSGAALCPGCSPPPITGSISRSPGARRTIAVWDYSGAARSLVLDLKLRGQRDSAAPLIEGLCAAARREGVAADAVTWVPGGRDGVRRRGFDHAEVLARGVAAVLGLAAAGVLQRRADRPDQAGLGAAERRRNLSEAFAAGSSRGRWLLVDDVITTGATVEACSAALGASGATAVEVLVACRA